MENATRCVSTYNALLLAGYDIALNQRVAVMVQIEANTMRITHLILAQNASTHVTYEKFSKVRSQVTLHRKLWGEADF